MFNITLFKGFGGFSAYAKSNPFQAAIASGGGIKNSFALFGKTNPTMPPPLQLPSPKSPKVNPFSSPSPAHNPFMTIAENKEDLWKTMARDKLSVDEANKSFFGESKTVKSVFQLHASTSTETNKLVTSNSIGSNNNDNDNVDNDEEEGGADDANDDSNALDTQNFVKYTLPEVVVINGEEQDQCLLQVRAKLFRLHTAQPIVPSSTTTSSAEHNEDTTATNEDKEKVIKVVPKIPTSSVFSLELPKPAEADNTTSKSAEWVEVGIGPVKLLQSQQESSDSTGNGKKKQVGRLVMRREEKKGGIGKLSPIAS